MSPAVSITVPLECERRGFHDTARPRCRPRCSDPEDSRAARPACTRPSRPAIIPGGGDDDGPHQNGQGRADRDHRRSVHGPAGRRRRLRRRPLGADLGRAGRARRRRRPGEADVPDVPADDALDADPDTSEVAPDVVPDDGAGADDAAPDDAAPPPPPPTASASGWSARATRPTSNWPPTSPGPAASSS
ncbi:MAG: hypothetical protein M0C28_11205 [Candidatus Moduliflexus flocculans]|nr:hypothetical protein [Candidatus Moduliflexus flocculans]